MDAVEDVIGAHVPSALTARFLGRNFMNTQSLTLPDHVGSERHGIDGHCGPGPGRVAPVIPGAAFDI